MAQIEDKISTAVVEELDAGETPAGSHGTFQSGAGPGTSGMNYSPGSTPGGTFSSMNEGTGTQPLAGLYVDPHGDLQTPREVELAEVIAQAKRDRAAADESFRRFCSGPVSPSGYVAGLPSQERK